MAEEEVKEEIIEKPSAGPKSSKNPFLTLVLLLNIVLMGAVAYFQYMSHVQLSAQTDLRDVIKAEILAQSQKDAEITGDVEVPNALSEGQYLQLDPFAANLAQGDGPRRYVRVTAVLKFSKEAKEEEFKSRRAQIRDSVISILNSKRPEDLLKAEGKTYLKEEIKASINSFLMEGFVSDVFYTSFQVN